MAQSYTTNDGITLVNPGTYVSITVQPGSANIASAGVVTIFGEAEEGPDWTAEADISLNSFTPDQYGSILQKYKEGRIVDGASKLIAAANDPNIVGAVSLIRVIKSNKSQAAVATISRPGFGNYAKETAITPGMPGNLISYQSLAAVAEQAPATGLFTYCPQLSGSVSFNLRNNGGAIKAISVSAKEAPSALQAAIEDPANSFMALGGQLKTVIGASGLTLAATVIDTATLQVTLQSGSLWQQAPAAGDVAVIPSNGDYGAAQNSAIVGAGQANEGSYIVSSVVNSLTSAVLTLKKINVSGALIAASATTHADFSDILLFSAMNIKNVSGQDRQSLVGTTGTYNVTSNDGVNVVMSSPANWPAQPQVGDYASFATTFAGVNAGTYQVTSSTANTVSLTRLSVGSSGSGSGSQSVGSPPTQSTQPFFIKRPVIDGLGKSMAIEGNVEGIFYNPASFAADQLSNSLQVSAAEYSDQWTVAKGTTSQSFTAGGDIAIQIGCQQEAATAVVQADHIDFKVGATIVFTASYAQYPTMAALAAWINSQTTFSASVPVAKNLNLPPSALDEGTFGLSSGLASVKPGRIKHDAIAWLAAVNGSGLAQASLLSFSGLPDQISPAQFLQGGTRAGSSGADVVGAIDAMENIDTNFCVSLFSQDASKDIATGDTDSSSTYSIASINAALNSHVIAMSALEMRKNRIAVGSIRDTYVASKQAAGQIASFRFAMTFQDIKASNSIGQIEQFQPWMGSIVAAGMQAAAGYKGIVKKFANVSGVLKNGGDFNATNPGSTKDALQSGLLVMEPVRTGGFRWVSDQTTYSVDNNFVYNSLQAVYIADLIALSLIDTYDALVVGKSVAEISAAAALSILDSEMFNFKRLKWIAASDGAPKGYRNATANLIGGALAISCEVKLAGLIYFVPISLLISQVEQSASA